METLYLPKQLSLPVEDIIYLQSDSNYTQIYTKGSSCKTLVALSLCKIQDSLGSNSFVRVNRSCLINLRYVKQYSHEHNHIQLTLKNNTQVRSSRRRTALVINILENYSNTLSQ